MNILLGVTGSAASVLTPNLVTGLVNIKGNYVKVVATELSLSFWDIKAVSVSVFTDNDRRAGSRFVANLPSLCVELCGWADMLVVAPLSANILAGIANGVSDNLLTSIFRAWERKPIVLAPAMDGNAWEHPITEEHLRKVKGWFPRTHIVFPIKKKNSLDGYAPIDIIIDTVIRVSGISPRS